MMIENINILKRLYTEYTKKHVKKVILAFILSIFVAGSTSSIAYLLDPAIKKIFIEKDQSLIYLIPLAIVATFSIKGLTLYLSKIIMIRVAEEVKTEVQKDMLKSLISSDTSFIDKSHSGNFISNLTNDVSSLVPLISVAILTLFKDTLTLIGLLFVMFLQNWKLSLIAIIMIPLAGFVSRTLGKRVTKVAYQMLNKAGIFTKRLIEIFKNHKLIKIFQAEKLENERSSHNLDELKEKLIKTSKVFNRNTPIMECLTGILIAALLIYAGKLIQQNELEINNFFSFLAAMMLAYQPVRALAGLNISINQGLVAAKRVLPVIDIKNDINENKKFPDLKIKKGKITFKNIYFKYDKEVSKATLNNINIEIEGGKTTALVGLSGAGKSTILNLIPRLYRQSSGQILIDDQSIDTINLFSLRKEISMVSQDTTLFDDTIKNNIIYANSNATHNELIEVCKKSFAEEFILKLPKKYDTIIGENGLRLSGGEKQRISIARAMLKNSKIILLDEATSSLDSETENKIQTALEILTKDKTAVVIAHRLSTILNSDQIYVIENGNVIDKGTHSDLIKNSASYKNFYEKQVAKA
jgi:subfamily B ATP-binding cassette protein MsbA